MPSKLSPRSSSIPETVQVAVRIRPQLPYEQQLGYQDVVEQTAPDEPEIRVRNQEIFRFSHVFNSSIGQTEIYETAVRSITNKLVDGFNVTILAYGQTGSGKSYTMGTSFDGMYNEQMGIIPRVMVDLFDQMVECGDIRSAVTCSFVELYQENVYDLFSYRNRFEKMMGIREDVTGVIIPGLTEIQASTADEVLRLLIQGASARAVASTSMNKESNRSHTIFTLNIRQVKEEKSVTVSKLHLVDLAGSERSKKTRASGNRLKESIQINKGLLALGNVIAALGSNKNTKGYICYRDSKLTRLLQNSLGGNSITLMIACISPSSYNLDETLSTLRYADRALKIHNKPTMNVGIESLSREEIHRLKIENDELRAALVQLQNTPPLPVSKDDRCIRKLQEKIRMSNAQLRKVNSKSNRLEHRAVQAENTLQLIFQLLSLDDISNFKDQTGDILWRYRKESEAWNSSDKKHNKT
ncbi:chromosome-associated kinesin KIF4-like [Uranotaenia lowii]|uniref:chromosome-associated kinesin KIF4-like n=1 Tax=Uranotaenia lowii TaxID=190385 RepID=UPI002479A4D2|nr:chromosome-associated kinesin KIF4-like [Uranotaenia lowii]